MTDVVDRPRLVPVDPPPPAWEAAARRLAEHVEAARALAEHAARDWLDVADARVLAPLRTTAERAAAAHARHAEPLLRARDEPAGTARWRAAAAYRDAVRADVVRPLRSALAAAGPADVADAYGRLLATLAAHADIAPEAAVLSAPADLFEPDARDGTIRRARKAAVRARRAGRASALAGANTLRRLARRAARPLPPVGRTVPARRLAQYHASVRLPNALAPLHVALQEAFAARVAALERALASWTHGVLTAEAGGDDAAFHPDGDPLAAPPPPGPDLDALVGHAEALGAALAAAAQPVDVPAPDDAALAAATESAHRDVALGGTFFLRAADRAVPARGEGPAVRAAELGAAHAARHTRAAGTAELCDHLLDLRATLLALEDRLLARVARRGLMPLLDAFRTLAGALRSGLASAEASLRAGPAPQEVRALRTRLLARFAPVLRDLPGLLAAEEALRGAGTDEGADAADRAAVLPERLLVHAPTEAPRGGALADEAPHRSVPLRDVAEEALQPPLPGRLAAAADTLRRAVVDMWGAVEGVEHIVRYSLDAALDELERPAEADTDAADDAEERRGGARELVRGGLTRAADRLEELAAALDGPWRGFATAVPGAFADDWQDLHRRVRTDAAVERTWTRLEMRLRRSSGHARRTADAALRAHTERLRRLGRLARRRGTALVRRGQVAVGVRDGAPEDRRAVLDALTDAGPLRARLPLVYRKLFTFEPLEEPALLEGRTADLGRARAHAERWHSGAPAGPLVVTLALGAGQTTFLNALAAALRPAFDVRRLTLTARPDEATLAALVADALGVPPDEPDETDAPDAPDAGGLAALEERIVAAFGARPDGAPPTVLLVDNLEHLLLRAPGGRTLLDRALLFFARIAEHVLVFSATGQYTWRFVDRTAAGTAALATVHAAAPIDRSTVEALVLGRHRRSGLPLRFAPPAEPPPLLRQRLRRARGEEAQQAVLRADFFDRLHRAAGQNVMLALFYWLRAVDVATEPGRLVVRPLAPLPFAFLAALDLPSAFTLKAFVLHHTLTVEEHNRIFRMRDAQSTTLLAALLALRLIEPADPALRGAGDAQTRLRPDARYRLNPLLLHPLAEHLHARHILY